MSSLYQLNEQFTQLKLMLENGDIDEQTYQDTISCIEVDLSEKAENYCKIIAEWQGNIETIKAEQDRLSDLKKRHEHNIQTLKDNLQNTMLSQEKQSISAGTYIIKIKQNPPSVNILDANLIPKKYYIKQEPELSKKMVADDLKSGLIVKGAELITKQSLQIK